MVVHTTVDLSKYSSMNIGGIANKIVEIQSTSEIEAACKDSSRILVIGEGTNTIFKSEKYEQTFLQLSTKGIKLEDTVITAQAGEHGDEVVEAATNAGLYGIEFLSKIPGSVGAAPIQNIGAYGQELSDTLVSLQAYDLQESKFVDLTRDQCDFGYRTSRFKSRDTGRFIITEITLQLNTVPSGKPLYSTLQKYMADNSITGTGLQDIRETLIKWRSEYLPDPSVIPNCGSFFTNPIISTQEFEAIVAKYPELLDHPTTWYWEVTGGGIKTAAGRLADTIRLKDWQDDDSGFATWKNSALVVVNNSAKNYSQLANFKQKYLDSFEKEFGIRLQQEPLEL